MVLLKSDNVWASYFITSCFKRAEASSGHGRSGALFKKHGRDEKRHVKFFISVMVILKFVTPISSDSPPSTLPWRSWPSRNAVLSRLSDPSDSLPPDLVSSSDSSAPGLPGLSPPSQSAWRSPFRIWTTLEGTHAENLETRRRSLKRVVGRTPNG